MVIANNNGIGMGIEAETWNDVEVKDRSVE